MPAAAFIRAQVEQRLSVRGISAFHPGPAVPYPVLITGITAIDSVLGGIPCGQITEIVAERWCSAGRRSLQLKLLAQMADKEPCSALIDANDSFDPQSAQLAGVDLTRLLWIRCSGRGMKKLEQALKSADLLLQGAGGFGLVMLDVADVPESAIRRVPLSTWFRFRGVVEKLPAPLLLFTSSSAAGTCSALTINLMGAEPHWSQAAPDSPAHGRLATQIGLQLKVTAKRSLKKLPHSVRSFAAERQSG